MLGLEMYFATLSSRFEIAGSRLRSAVRRVFKKLPRRPADARSTRARGQGEQGRQAAAQRSDP